MKKKLKECNCKIKMTSEERFHAILEAAAPLFAEKGFEGTTTKEIAQAADVSEALLYRHFSGKKELYKQLFLHLCHYDGQKIEDLVYNCSTSTEKLIFIVFIFFSEIFYRKASKEEEMKIIQHLSLRSLLEDGQFFKTLLEAKLLHYFDDIVEIIEESKSENSFVRFSLPNKLTIWFIHHLAFTLGIMALPGSDFLPYESSREDRLLHGIRFTLRGMGMKDEIIQKKITPSFIQKSLALLENMK